MYINTITNQYPVTEQEIKNLYPNTSFSAVFVAPDNWKYVFAVPKPAYNAISQTAVEVSPMVSSKGHYEQVWKIVDLSAEQTAANQLESDKQAEEKIASKIELLWKAADTYTSAYISGVAIGILTLGVIQQKPKALAVSAWSSSVWDMYYTRKSLVTADSVDDLDFSSAGAMPFTVPELKAEIGL